MRIEDYALIGDCETAALVGRNGSIDWLCLPRFDSPACFAALLGGSEHGRWLLAPTAEVRAVRRQYRGDTMVLETVFETSTGTVAIVDGMPRQVPQVLRRVEGRRGRVAMRMELAIRFDYGSVVPWVRRTPGGMTAIAGPSGLALHTPVELRGEDFRTVGEFTVSEAEVVPFCLAWYPSQQPPPDATDVDDGLRETERWWREWSSRCTYKGEWRDAVMRSLLTL
jgi:GH15 family glucan-1,4-alpha-glucosidase